MLISAEELREIRWKSGEKRFYQLLNAAPEIRYPIKTNLATSEDKVWLIVQATLADVDMPSSREFEHCRRQYEMDGKLAFAAMSRLIRCIVDCQIYLKSGTGTKSALEVTRSLAAKVWDDSPLQMRQIHGVGPVAVRKLIGAGIMSLEELDATEPHRINVLMSRNTGFGESLHNKLRDFPKLSICLRVLDKRCRNKSSPVVRFSVDIGFLNETVPKTFNKKPVFVCLVAERSDGLLIDFNRFSATLAARNPIHLSVEIQEPTHKIVCSVMCDEIAGTVRSAVLDPKCPSSFFDSEFSGRAECGLSQPLACEISTPHKKFVRPSGGDTDQRLTTPKVRKIKNPTSTTLAVVGGVDWTDGGRPKRPRDLQESDIAETQVPSLGLVQAHPDQHGAGIAPRCLDGRSSSIDLQRAILDGVSVTQANGSNNSTSPKSKKPCSYIGCHSSLGTLRLVTDGPTKDFAETSSKRGVLLHGDYSSDTDLDDPYSTRHREGICGRSNPSSYQHYNETTPDTFSRYIPEALNLQEPAAHDGHAPNFPITAAGKTSFARQPEYQSTPLSCSGGLGLQNPQLEDKIARRMGNFDAKLLHELDSCIELLEDP